MSIGEELARRGCLKDTVYDIACLSFEEMKGATAGLTSAEIFKRVEDNICRRKNPGNYFNQSEAERGLIMSDTLRTLEDFGIIEFSRGHYRLTSEGSKLKL